MRANAKQRKMSPISAVNALLLVSLSLLLLPDLVVTEFVEMRLVEVNGAGWYLQLVSNRRGPGHLIICLLIARRRTNRSCRKEARTNKKKTQHKEVTPAGKSSSERGCWRAGTSWERMLWAMQGLPMYLSFPRRPAAQLLPAPPCPLPGAPPPPAGPPGH